MTTTTAEIVTDETLPLNDGIQRLVKFSNGYGASIVKHTDIQHLNLITHNHPKSPHWGIDYRPPTHLVLDAANETEALTQIAALPDRSQR